MSTLKTTYIQHPSAASPNLELKADGTLALPLSGIGDLSDVDEGSGASDGDVLTYDGVGNVWVPESIVFPAGIGSNVVQTVKTDTFTTTSTSLTDVTGLAATITPTSATSKVLVVASVSQGMREAAANKAGWTVARGATNLVVPDSPGNRIPVPIYTMHNFSDGGRNVILSTFVFLDSLATTSATEYKVRAIVQAGTFYLNRSESDTDSAAGSRGVSTLTLIEVAA